MTPDLVALKAELVTDPSNVGYAALIAGDDWRGVEKVFNLPTGGQKRARALTPSGTVKASIVRGEWATLAPIDREYLTFLLAGEVIDVSATEVRAGLGAVFKAGTVSAGNLLLLLDRPGSRAEDIFGTQTVVGFEMLLQAWRA